MTLLIPFSICCCIIKYQAKQKHFLPFHNARIKEIDIKNYRCYYFDDITKVDDSDFDKILIQEKSYKNIWFTIFHAKLCLVQNLYVLDLMK